jgi:hypothetical protein
MRRPVRSGGQPALQTFTGPDLAFQFKYSPLLIPQIALPPVIRDKNRMR